MDDDWHLEGDRFADSFNMRQAIASTEGRLGYLKLLQDTTPEDPWIEQWANEQIVSDLARLLDLPAVEAAAGAVEGTRGAITVFLEGRKLSELEFAGYRLEPLMAGALNRAQFGLMAAFDVWLLNVDRGTANLFVTVEGGRPRLRLIDHGHTLLLPREQKKAMPAPADWKEFVVSGVLEQEDLTKQTLGGFLRAHVASEEIKEGARTIAQVEDDAIARVIEAVPEEFFCGPTPDAMASLLTNRRDKLSECLEGVL
jgi:hypothetical protein